jgi:hypothetical protein
MKYFILITIFITTSCATPKRRSISNSKTPKSIYWAKGNKKCMKSSLENLRVFFHSIGQFEVNEVYDENMYETMNEVSEIVPNYKPNILLKVEFYNNTPTQLLFTSKEHCVNFVSLIKKYRK